MSKKKKKDSLKINKDELIEKLWSNGLNGMLDVIEKKLMLLIKKTLKKERKKLRMTTAIKTDIIKAFSMAVVIPILDIHKEKCNG